MKSELIIDSFAGGGGASLGIAWALGRAPDIAINHDAAALAMHEANHPSTRHVLEDVWRADLPKLTGGQPVGLLWASPDCKHFSRAKGAKPVEKSIRSLAWIVCRWAAEVQPRIIALENVREFADWGPLVPRWECRDCAWRGTEGQAVLVRTRRKCPRCESRRLHATADMVPCPERKGLTFRRFVGRLKKMGYDIEWRNLDAADYGAPTHRKRLFLVARCDGQPIAWPEPTHGPAAGELTPYRTAADCIDWQIPCPSIFTRSRPLAEKTMQRIALGIKRYVLDAAEPFIVPITHSGQRNNHDINKPLPTITTAQRGELALVSPILSRFNGSKTPTDDRCKQLDLPFSTLDTQPRFALVAPHLVAVGHGERAGQKARAMDVQHPLGTITSKGHHALCAAFLAKHFGGEVGQQIDRPAPTATVRSTQQQLVAANLIHLNHGEKQWSACDDPMRTVTTGNHAALVYSFLVKYFGTAVGANLYNPMPTATGKDRFGLVTVEIQGEPYVIVDIGMRMLTPRELARAQGFPDTYELTGTKTNQVARIGNSVCPHVAAAVVRANVLSEVPA